MKSRDVRNADEVQPLASDDPRMPEVLARFRALGVGARNDGGRSAKFAETSNV